MADNYIQPVNDHFAFGNTPKLEDVDDNDFLRNSRLLSNGNVGVVPLRKGEGGASAVSNNSPTGDEPIRQQQYYEQRRREIEERSLESTQRSLGLLYDSEQVGTAAAVELAKQRDQLERTNKNLDDMNASLRYSQRHLNGIKSVFGSIKNYFSGGNREPANANADRKLSTDSHVSQASEGAKGMGVQTTTMISPNEKYDQHPIARLRGEQPYSQQTNRSKPFEVQLEANLNEMSDNLSRLKGLASELGSEIETQNDLLDKMNYKIEDVDIKLSRQNKEITKLLGKK